MNCIKTYNLTLAAKYINRRGLMRSNMAGPKRADGAFYSLSVEVNHSYFPFVNQVHKLGQ
jgi:hypothetical protein